MRAGKSRTNERTNERKAYSFSEIKYLSYVYCSLIIERMAFEFSIYQHIVLPICNINIAAVKSQNSTRHKLTLTTQKKEER